MPFEDDIAAAQHHSPIINLPAERLYSSDEWLSLARLFIWRSGPEFAVIANSDNTQVLTSISPR